MRAPRERVTEQHLSSSSSLDRLSALEVLRRINREDGKVAKAVRRALPQIARATDLAVRAISNGGRMIYIGAGTSGRLGVLDAAECIPTFGTHSIQAVMAGAPRSMFRPTEVSEDNPAQAIKDLRKIRLSKGDVLVGISASGRTPYTMGGLRYARKIGAQTVAITCNPAAPFLAHAKVGIVAIVGPEIIAGSSRMKAGTAEKLILNMLSSATMIRLGRVLAGRMISVQLTNEKLRERGRKILMKETGIKAQHAATLLKRSGWQLPVAILMVANSISRTNAEKLLNSNSNTAALLRSELKIRRRGERAK